MNSKFINSEIFFQKAKKIIPLGTQTFSKSIMQYPFGISPLYSKKAKGCKIWDLDDNIFLDLVNSLAAITIGYSDPDINRAVKKQINKGTIFSLTDTLEYDVSKLIVQMVPSAEKVRFGKNGSDATSAAIRLSRAITNKQHIAFCGYHGWQDWFIGATSRNLGVPNAVKKLTHKFIYNDIESLLKIYNKFPGDVAAVIIEPMNIEYPRNYFLEELKDLTRKKKSLLIFDETITGFRFSNGGAQEYFKVTPDLSTFGKGIANGFPLSAIVGKSRYMSYMDKIFFSSTFGGDTVSLAASKVTLNKLISNNICNYIHSIGLIILKELPLLIKKHNLENIFSVSGHPSWTFLLIKPFNNYSVLDIKTLLLKELFCRNILFIGSHNLSFSHKPLHIKKLLKCYDEVFPIIHDAVYKKKLKKLLNYKTLKEVFSVR